MFPAVNTEYCCEHDSKAAVTNQQQAPQINNFHESHIARSRHPWQAALQAAQHSTHLPPPQTDITASWASAPRHADRSHSHSPSISAHPAASPSCPGLPGTSSAAKPHDAQTPHRFLRKRHRSAHYSAIGAIKIKDCARQRYGNWALVLCWGAIDFFGERLS